MTRRTGQCGRCKHFVRTDGSGYGTCYSTEAHESDTTMYGTRYRVGPLYGKATSIGAIGRCGEFEEDEKVSAPAKTPPAFRDVLLAMARSARP